MRWGILSIATGIGIIFASGCDQKKPPEQPVKVTVAPAVEGSVVGSSRFVGQAKAYDSVNLVARVKGFLTKRLFREGQMVKKGDLLFEIEKDQYKAELEQAKGVLLKAQAGLKNAQIEYDRQAKLLKENATAQRTYDDAVCKKMEAQAGVMQAEAQVQNAQLNLSYTDIRSPFDGRVGLTTYSTGNVVGPDSQSLASVVSLNPIRILFNVSELDLLNMRLEKQELKEFSPPKNLVVRLQFQNGVMYTHSGEISFCNNTINASTGTLLVESLMPNPEHVIFPGMYVNVIVEDKQSKKAVLIPQCAVQQDQAGSYVLVVDPQNKVSTKYIKTGITNGPCVEVTEGIKPGELVIIEGLQKVRRDSIVSPVVDKTYSYADTAEHAAAGAQKAVTKGQASGPAAKQTAQPTKNAAKPGPLKH